MYASDDIRLVLNTGAIDHLFNLRHLYLLKNWMASLSLITCGDLYIDGLAQECSISIANSLEILLPYTEPSISYLKNYGYGLRFVVCICVLLQFEIGHGGPYFSGLSDKAAEVNYQL